MDSTSVTEPSLSSRAMLCALSISMWSARKQVDPQELRKSESVRNETAKVAAAIAQRMSPYVAGYSVPAVTTTITVTIDEWRSA